MSTDSALKRALDNYDKLAANYEALKQELDYLKKRELELIGIIGELSKEVAALKGK